MSIFNDEYYVNLSFKEHNLAISQQLNINKPFNTTYVHQYFIIVFIVFVTMLLGGILGYVFRERVEVTMRQEMLSSLRLYGNRRAVTDAWDATQERLHCCGVYSPADWRDRVPESCCIEPVPGKKQPCQDLSIRGTRYQEGCLNVTTMYVKEHAAVIGGAGIAVACIMVSTFTFYNKDVLKIYFLQI